MGAGQKLFNEKPFCGINPFFNLVKMRAQKFRIDLFKVSPINLADCLPELGLGRRQRFRHFVIPHLHKIVLTTAQMITDGTKKSKCKCKENTGAPKGKNTAHESAAFQSFTTNRVRNQRGLKYQQLRLYEHYRAECEHQDAAHQRRPLAVFMGNADLVDGIERQPENEKIIHHVHEDIEPHICLARERAQLIQLQELRKRLRNADGTGELENVHGEREPDNAQCHTNGHGFARKQFCPRLKRLFLLRTGNIACLFVRREFICEIHAAHERKCSHQRRHDAIKLHKIPCCEPYVQNEIIHHRLGKNEQPRILKHSLARPCLRQDDEKHEQDPQRAGIEAIHKSEHCRKARQRKRPYVYLFANERNPHQRLRRINAALGAVRAHRAKTKNICNLRASVRNVFKSFILPLSFYQPPYHLARCFPRIKPLQQIPPNERERRAFHQLVTAGDAIKQRGVRLLYHVIIPHVELRHLLFKFLQKSLFVAAVPAPLAHKHGDTHWLLRPRRRNKKRMQLQL